MSTKISKQRQGEIDAFQRGHAQGVIDGRVQVISSILDTLGITQLVEDRLNNLRTELMNEIQEANDRVRDDIKYKLSNAKIDF